MIHMPHRSVTRFFIPLIDVLLLLFGIFLLMPIASETEFKDQLDEATGEQKESVAALQYELQRRTEELQRFEQLRPALAEVEKLKEEIKRLESVTHKGLQERVDVQIIDIDPKTGELSYYDPGRSDPRVSLPDKESVRQLIARQRPAAHGRELYYYFLFPRPETGYPTLGQKRRYQSWFASVPHSLKEARP
jgi:DNA-directed RNA polymerase subunit F